MANFIHLENRQLISISGKDRFTFLQGLISNDVNKAAENKGQNGAIYALMLNPQARFLYEFFIVAGAENLILEIAKETGDNLVKKLSFYKLRSEVSIAKIEDLQVFFIDDSNFKIDKNINFSDPRKQDFGLRFYGKKEDLLLLNLPEKDLNFYHNLRLKNKIVDENDLTFDQSIIVEYGFDDLNAIDYKKGCYVGQEVVARSHYRGQIRKKIFLIEIENLDKISKGSEITCDGKKAGIVLSSLFGRNGLLALALIKNVDASDNQLNLQDLDLRVEGQKIIIKC